MILTFLEGAAPLTKTYERRGSELIKTPYPHVYEVTSHTEQVADLAAFESALQHHASLSRCLLKGTLSRPLKSESRAGTTDRNGATDWICLDLDGVPTTADVDGTKVDVTLDCLLYDLGLHNISYVLQWSASYGVDSKALRAHVFMQLDQAQPAPLIKQWLIQKNFESRLLSSAFSLTKTNNALHWPLDISACQNDKLIYIAPPILRKIKDPLATKPRIQLIRKTKHKLSLGTVNSTTKNQELIEAKLNELRNINGLSVRKNKYKHTGTTEVLLKPDVCTVTEIKEERGFVYFNLNGGDSWGYYHPENNPDYIYNFKGEPAYLTKELLPDYWAELHSRVNQIDSNGILKLAFLDPKTDRYWRGVYDSNNDKLAIEATSSALALTHYAKSNSIPLPENVIPEWNLVFDPHMNERVDMTSRTINLFQPTQYMRAKPKHVTVIPKLIRKVIFHAVGSDEECFNRFINWLAYVLQTRDRPLTAWIFHGVPGTGKGTLLAKILRPLFGHEHIATPRMKELEKEFNSFIGKSLIVAVDEVETDALYNERGVMADLRRYITEEFVPLRRMHRDAKLTRNYSAWLFFSNASAPVRVTKDDRRFNVAKYQAEKLNPAEIDFDAIAKELQAFHDYLMTHKVNLQHVIEPLMNQDREELMDLTESAIDTVSNALLTGDMQWFMDQLPTGTTYASGLSSHHQQRTDDYRATLKVLLERTDTTTGRCNIARDELRALYDYTVGKIPESPNKFTSLLKHHRIRTVRLRIGDKNPYGITVKWQSLGRWPAHLRVFQPVKLKQVK